MIRHVAAVAIALCLSPAWLFAQTTVIAVNTKLADVHLGPSTGSPIIGHAPEGAVLPVTRELGSWVKVSWPAAKDGVGYLHVSWGLVRHDSAAAPGQPAQLTAAPTASRAAEPSLAQVTIPVERPVPGRLAPMRPVYVSPSTHLIGVGGVVTGSNLGFGASARAWSRKRFGMQFDMSRSARTGADGPGRVMLLQFEPSLLYSLSDHVTDYVWLRPYLGSGGTLRRQTLSSAAPGAEPLLSDSQFGLHVFGGGELTFANAPRLGLSVDLGYQWARTSFAGVDFGGPAVSVSGHWYVK